MIKMLNLMIKGFFFLTLFVTDSKFYSRDRKYFQFYFASSRWFLGYVTYGNDIACVHLYNFLSAISTAEFRSTCSDRSSASLLFGVKCFESHAIQQNKNKNVLPLRSFVATWKRQHQYTLYFGYRICGSYSCYYTILLHSISTSHPKSNKTNGFEFYVR